MDSSDQYINLIIKHLCGETSPNEEQDLHQWLDTDAQNKEQFDEIKAALELSEKHADPEVAAIDVDNEWNKIESSIDFGTKTKVVDFEKTTKQSSFNWMKIAAVILVLVTIGGGWYFLSLPSKTNLFAENKILENKLPDGSNVVLKEQSSLVYDDTYNETKRKVVLSGEAFFEVKPDASKPFIVDAGKLKIEVLGTKFLVKNIASTKETEVIVKEGQVLVYNSENKVDSVILEAGEKTSLNNNTTKLEKQINEDQNFMAWKTKTLNFDNTSLSQAIATINDTYNSNIVLTNKELENCTLKVKFENYSLESILTVLQSLFDIEIKQTGNKIEISGDGCKNKHNE